LKDARAAGLDPKREIIVYGSRGSWNPYFGLYTVQYFGRQMSASIMKGSRTGPQRAAISQRGFAASAHALKLESIRR